MFSTNGNLKVLIGKDLVVTSTPSVDPYSANFIADGEITILTEDSSGVLSVAYPSGVTTVREYIKIAQRSGDKVHYSPRIKTANITKATKESYTAAVDQIDYIGYNTSSGSIEEMNNNQYMIHLTYRHDDKIWSEQLNKRTYVYYSDSSCTQSEVASDFVKQINMDPYTQVSAVMVNDSVSASLTTTGQNVVVNKGSTTITFAATVAATVTAGCYLKIGGTAATTPVYKVKSVTSATVYELDTPYQGTSATVLSANVNVCNAITYVGIKLSAIPLTYKAKGIAPYNRVVFETAIANFGSTTVTKATAMTWGSGVYEQVADMEWFALGGDGIRNFMWHPIPEGRTDATSGKTYDTYCIEYYNTDDVYVVSGTKPSKGVIYLFFEHDATAGHNKAVFEANFNYYSPVDFV